MTKICQEIDNTLDQIGDVLKDKGVSSSKLNFILFFIDYIICMIEILK